MDKQKEQAISNAREAMINVPYDVTEAKRAEEIQEQAAAIRNIERPEGRYSIEDAVILLRAETGDYYPLGKAVESDDIPCYKHETGDKKGNPQDLRSYVCWDDLNKWIEEKTDIRKFRFPNPNTPAAMEATLPASDDTETIAGMVYWKGILKSNINYIDLAGKKKAGVRSAIKHLKNLGDTRLPNEGSIDELFWFDDYSKKQRISKKTVSNALSEIRKVP